MDSPSVTSASRVCVWLGKDAPPGADHLRSFYGDSAGAVRVWGGNGTGGVLVAHRNCAPEARPCGSTLRIIIGDSLEYEASEACRAEPGNCALLDVPLHGGSLSARSSFTGLPPLFLATYRGGVLIGSDVPSVVIALGALPAADALGVADAVRWGYPIGSRTLFKGISTLEPSSTVCAEMNGALTFTRNRSLSNLDSQTSADLIGDTIAAFESAVGRVMRESPFVSLSGGIDSRTVVVAAVHKGFRPACVSMASSSRSRDALQAAAVCAALHLDHEIVSLSGTFRNQLPELVARAAQITGGVDCVAQAADMFMYQAVGGRFQSRVSGNLGNQVGQGGVESIPSMARMSLLDAELRASKQYSGNTPWYLQSHQGAASHVELRMREAMWYSLANYNVGAHFVSQLTPYADHAVMRAAMPLLLRAYGRPSSARGLRMRDARHRLMGPRMADSFQRQYLRAYAGATANVPINLGWLAAGGWSTSALFRGVESVVATLVDQHIPARLRSIRPVAEWVSTRATISSLVRPQDAVREPLRRLFLDTLHSSVCEELEGLDVTATRTAIVEHSAGRRDRSLDLLPIFQIALGRQVLRQLVKNIRNAYRSSIDSAAPLT